MIESRFSLICEVIAYGYPIEIVFIEYIKGCFQEERFSMGFNAVIT